jgi:hypothetical protein
VNLRHAAARSRTTGDAFDLVPRARQYTKRRDGARRPACSRPAFQIWPHAVQRQYVETSTALLVVVMSAELQNGHAVGATLVSAGGVCM